MSTEALKLALEALKDNQHLVADNERHAYVMEYNSIIEKLEEALKQEQGEPYGYVDAKGGGLFIYGEHQFQNTKNAELVPVYLHPKQEQGEPVAVKHMMRWIESLKRQSDYGQHMRIPGLNAGACFELAIELEQFINTTPQQRTWVDLPLEETDAIIDMFTGDPWTAVEEIKARLKERNT